MGTHTNLRLSVNPVNPLGGKIWKQLTTTSRENFSWAPAHARHLGLSARQIYRLVYNDDIPTFKLGGAVAARRSTLARWLTEKESAARAAA
ncbi:helix-turn-helix domain-containing protein [Shinella yambaruensis]|uniref:helix-turn-helix domain-containing protein n=1 Tax=Shinella yambaruensis TaxID=415996 RepID=UPI003D7B2D16